MTLSGRKRSHLQLVDAVSSVSGDLVEAGKCGRLTKKGTPCKRRAGSGTTHPGEGECMDHEGQVDPDSPCPLPLTPLELRLWTDITDSLRKTGLLNHAFWPSLYGLVVALAGLSNARREALQGATVSDAKGSIKKHPATTTVNQMLAHVRTYSAELGLTPSSLAKVGTPGDGPPSPMDTLIGGSRR